MKKNSLIVLAVVSALSLSLTGCASAAPQRTTASTQAVAPQPAAPRSLSQSSSPLPPDPAAAKESNIAVSAVTSPASAAGIISESKALEIARTHAGVKPEDILYSDVKLETDNGIQTYDVNFFTQGKEYDYDILAATGEISSYDYEVEDHVWAGQQSGAQTGAVTIDQAQKLALERVPGADASHIRIKTDTDNGKTIFEGSIIYDNVEYDFEIDAATGSILEWDSESVFD